MTKYPMNEELKKFPLFKIENRELVEITGEITSTKDYNHYMADIHHFVKKQRYYRNPKKYEGKQKLIIMTRQMHTHLEDPIYQLSSDAFYRKYRMWKSELLYTEE